MSRGVSVTQEATAQKLVPIQIAIRANKYLNVESILVHDNEA